MANFGRFESEVAFLSGVDDTGRAAPVSFFTYARDNPPTYKLVSDAIKWGDPTPGTPGGTVTYWFDTAAHWSNTEKMVWEGTFAFWSGLANITFVPVDGADAPDVILERGTDGRARTVFNFGTSVPVGSEEIRHGRHGSGAFISIDTSGNQFGPITGDSNAKGGYVWSTLLHEAGHMVGLGHTGPYNFSAGPGQQFGVYDTRLWSITSYFDPGASGSAYYGQYPVQTGWGTEPNGDLRHPLSPQMLDILAVQRLYGPSTNATFAGNQTFGFNSSFTGYLKNVYDFGAGNNPDAIVTIWSHGTNNALDLSGFSQNAVVDLTPGSFSSAGGKANNIGIAFDTVVETAKGGSGNDTLKASTVSSTLYGGDGNDTLIGGDGNDHLIGGAGDDILRGGRGVDTLDGGPGADIFQIVAGDAGNDIIADFSGHDSLGAAALRSDGLGAASRASNGQGDMLQFVGYGNGAHFARIDDTHWQVSSADGSISTTITVANGATITATDVSFGSTYTGLAHSTFRDFGAWRSNTTEGPSGGVPITGPVTLKVALVLDRTNDPTSLLQKSWADRQHELKTLADSGTLWSTYGADQARYDAVLNALAGLGIETVDQAGTGYVSSAASRTIWVQVTQESFSTLFGPQAKLMAQNADGSGAWYWTGDLSLPSALTANGVSGLWFDTTKVGGTAPAGAMGSDQLHADAAPARLGSIGAHDLDAAMAAVTPQGPLILSAGTGSAGGWNDDGYAAWQSAFWDAAGHPGVVGSSLGLTTHPTPGSPFFNAINQLFIDAGLHNVTVFDATADSGSGTAALSWAALAAQINAMFHDQGLPQLGYMNDLLQIASALGGAAFGGLSSGESGSGPSFMTGGFGQVSNLPAPDGILLARTLTAIAHHQTSYADTPGLLEAEAGGGWQSGAADHSFLIQATTALNTAVHVTLGVQDFDFVNGGSNQLAWTARLAQQVLQSDFDANLVRQFDKAGQGNLFQSDIAAGTDIAASIGGSAGKATQADYTSDYGFADFTTGAGTIHLARAVAVAETAGASDDQNAVVRVRQNGQDTLSVSFYRVDDHSGKIGTLAPGDTGYASAAAARMYTTQQGGTAVNGPGYGLYAQTELVHVNSGDLIAMRLTNQSSGNVFWAFSQANEKVGGTGGNAGVGHLWNYGTDTWGWEDARGGGDHDYNDLVVQLDFTSTHGHGWLV